MQAQHRYPSRHYCQAPKGPVVPPNALNNLLATHKRKQTTRTHSTPQLHRTSTAPSPLPRPPQVSLSNCKRPCKHRCSNKPHRRYPHRWGRRQP
ncbi:hypothetical protein HYQ46_009782 [Verticillium longisporum]|nr:hypothetical protein HYQ46_009782 [Verticillium longisporum]